MKAKTQVLNRLQPICAQLARPLYSACTVPFWRKPATNISVVAYMLQATMAQLEQFEDFVREKIEKEQWNHEQLSTYFSAKYQGKKGFSIRTVRRFCAEKNIRKTTKLSDADVDECISEAIAQVK